jgi:hypothetical protein
MVNVTTPLATVLPDRTSGLESPICSGALVDTVLPSIVTSASFGAVGTWVVEVVALVDVGLEVVLPSAPVLDVDELEVVLSNWGTAICVCQPAPGRVKVHTEEVLIEVEPLPPLKQTLLLPVASQPLNTEPAFAVALSVTLSP